MNLESRVFGMPAWGVLAALGAAGVVGYLIFFRNRGASGGSSGQVAAIINPSGFATNPADYSASIGTLENQLLNNQAELSSQIGAFQTGTYQGLGQISGQVLQNREVISQLPGGQTAYSTVFPPANTGGTGSNLTAITGSGGKSPDLNGGFSPGASGTGSVSSFIGGEKNLQPAA